MLGLADVYIFNEAFQRLKWACADDPVRLVDICRVDSSLAALCREVAEKAALQRAALDQNLDLVKSLQPELIEGLRDYDLRWKDAVDEGSLIGGEQAPAIMDANDLTGTWFNFPSPNASLLPAEVLEILGNAPPGSTPDTETADQETADQLVVLLSSALAAGKFGVFHIDLIRNRGWITDTMMAIQGYSREEAIHHPDWPSLIMPAADRRHVHPDDVEELVAVIGGSLRPGGTDVLHPEFRLKHKLGHWVWVQNVSLATERDATGRATKLLGVRKEVTERHEREARLRSLISELHETQRKLDLAIEGGNLGTWSWDAGSECGQLSAAAAALMGLDRAATPIGWETISKLVGPDDVAHLKEFAQALSTGERSGIDIQLPQADGETRWLHCVGRQTVGAGEKITIDGVIIDVTESRAASIRLMKSQQELGDAQMRALRYQVNPHFLFNSLSAASTMMLDGEGLQADDLIMKLAAFFRQTLNRDPLELVTLDEEVRTQEHYLSIEEVRFPDLRAEFEIDPELEDMLLPSLILQPLLENAIKYGMSGTGEEFLIKVIARREGDRANISVTDNGKGSKKSGGTGWGQRITEMRLRHSFPGEYEYSAGPLPGGGYSVTFGIPIRMRTPLDNMETRN